MELIKVGDIAAALENYAPAGLAGDFDNVGLLVGRSASPVSDVLLTLDVDKQVVTEALVTGAQMIISHHPIMFSPKKQITDLSIEGELILFMIENGIALYTAHTNLDKVSGGLNDLFAAFLGLVNVSVLKENESETGYGSGRIGYLDGETTLFELAQRCKKLFNMPFINVTGDVNAPVERIAICTGGGASMLKFAIEGRADVFISGDIKYNDTRDAAAAGLNIIHTGHYNTEIFAMDLFEKILTEAFGGGLKYHKSKSNVNVIKAV